MKSKRVTQVSIPLIPPYYLYTRTNGSGMRLAIANPQMRRLDPMRNSGGAVMMTLWLHKISLSNEQRTLPCD